MSSTIQEHSDPHTQVVVFVDPYSTECVTAQEMVRRGYNVMALWTHGFADEMKLHVPLSCAGLEYVAEITQIPDQVDATIELLRQTAGDLEIVACLAGGEDGMDFANVLSECMGLLSNGTDVPNRHDKKIQQELIAAAGVRMSDKPVETSWACWTFPKDGILSSRGQANGIDRKWWSQALSFLWGSQGTLSFTHEKTGKWC